MTTHQTRILVEQIITALCHGVIQHNMDFRIIREFEGEAVTIWNLSCLDSDRGRIIGRGGERFRALRTIAGCIGRLNRHDCKLGELRSSAPTAPSPFPSFKPKLNWPKNEIVQLAQATIQAMLGADAKATILDISGLYVLQMSYRMDGLNSQERSKIYDALENIFSGIATTHGAEISIDLVHES